MSDTITINRGEPDGETHTLRWTLEIELGKFTDPCVTVGVGGFDLHFHLMQAFFAVASKRFGRQLVGTRFIEADCAATESEATDGN